MTRASNVATALSLALALGAAAMWARSHYVVEGWESTPRPAGMVYQGSGFHGMWAVESSRGRVVYVRHKIYVRPDGTTGDRLVAFGAAYPSQRRPGFAPVPPGDPAPAGYYRANDADAVTPARYNRRFRAGPRPVMGPPLQYVSVPWLAVASAGLILPLCRFGMYRWRMRHRPGFQVLPPGRSA